VRFVVLRKVVEVIPSSSLRVVAAFAFGAISTGCGPSVAPFANASSELERAAPAGAAGYKVLYRFPGQAAGSTPTGLTAFKGAQYGTTINGGTHTFGTVFVRTATGVKILYSFKAGADGSGPTGALTAFGGRLYGMTEYGGGAGDGTVFSVDTQGNERVVYSFTGGSDGAAPAMGALLDDNGALYGTTTAGGDRECHVGKSVGCGIIFSLAPATGKESVLHRFSGKPDGASPLGTLLVSGGKIYGTTEFGGNFDNGSVFVLTGSKERRLYSFKGYPDGANPFAGLTLSNGTFYGTTAFGGAFDYSGTVFSLSAGGEEHVLYSFSGTPDGAIPLGGLTADGDALYGTTEYGGNDIRQCTGKGIIGCGIIFRITAAGREQSVYRFRGSPDGANPWASPILRNGTLFGTTTSGGHGGSGTIFSLHPTAK
jgi:uncharacterized repeat protein (TIGR03803 family)